MNMLLGKDGAHRVTLSFMQRNAFYSKRNFGNQADNATGNLIFLNLKVLNSFEFNLTFN